MRKYHPVPSGRSIPASCSDLRKKRNGASQSNVAPTRIAEKSAPSNRLILQDSTNPREVRSNLPKKQKTLIAARGRGGSTEKTITAEHPPKQYVAAQRRKKGKATES